MRTRLALGLVSACLAILLPGAVPSAPAAEVGARWEPAAKAKIHPGTQMYTKGAQCTANFVFKDARGRVYLGYAAHCAGLGESTDTNGCTTDSLPLGTAVTFREGGSLVADGTRVGRGWLAYSSWRTMQKRGVTNRAACAYNDFALVRVARGDVAKVTPSVPSWGGPSGVDRNGLSAGERVWSYGSSSVLGGESVLSPRRGVALPDDPADRGWTHTVYGLPPGVPGDSGSGYLSAGGKAVGVLSTLGIAPLAGSNNITDLGKALAFAQHYSGIPGLRLVHGTRAFSG